MATTKYQGFPTYRYAQIALKGSDRKGDIIEEGVESEVRQETDDREGPSNMSSDDSLIGDGIPNTSSRGGELEVDYESDVTALYHAISNSQWNDAHEALMANPQEARTWVVRYKEDDKKGVMWRFLPIHSACARQPPESIIRSLLEAYPEGAADCDDQGMYPLHYAGGNQASADVIRLLVQAFPNCATICDPTGMLPIHYMAQWGPSEPKAIDALLHANPQTNVRDDQGNTPLRYAEEGDYPLRQEMIASLKKGPITNTTKRKPQNSLPPISRRNINFNSNPQASTTTAPTGPLSLHSGGGKDDSSSLASNHAAPMQVVYRTPNSDTTVNSFSNNTSARSHPPSANKTVNKLNAQINKLRAEIEFNAAEYEEKLTEQREEHEMTTSNFDDQIKKSMNDNDEIRGEIRSKTEYGRYVEDRIGEVEKDINHYYDDNDRVEKELARYKEELRMEKAKAETFRMKINTLSSKMKIMIEDQNRIEKNLVNIEDDMKNASEERKKKLQELYDEEVKYSQELMTHKQVYGAGGPTVLSALSQQKILMENCSVVLSECDDAEL